MHENERGKSQTTKASENHTLNHPDRDRTAHVNAPGMSEEEIDYNLMGSFPASDPPSWTLGVGRHKTFVTEFEGQKYSDSDPSHQNEPETAGESSEETGKTES